MLTLAAQGLLCAILFTNAPLLCVWFFNSCHECQFESRTKLLQLCEPINRLVDLSVVTLSSELSIGV